MNVWKYIYIKFYEFRRRILGIKSGKAYAAMLFAASISAGCTQQPDVLVQVERNGLYGFVDEDGNKVVDCKYVFVFR